MLLLVRIKHRRYRVTPDDVVCMGNGNRPMIISGPQVAGFQAH
jgi:hypothetical protein